MTIKFSAGGSLKLSWRGSDTLLLESRTAAHERDAVSFSGSTLHAFFDDLSELVRSKPRPIPSRTQAKPPAASTLMVDGKPVPVIRFKV